MYVRKQPWCVYLVLNEQDDLRTFRKIISLYLCKSRFFENCTPSQKKIHKNLSPHFPRDFRRHTMRYKINPFTFYAEKSTRLQPQNKNALTFSADLSRLLCAKNMSPHFYKGIQKHFDHQNFSPFTNCLQIKKKHLSLLLPIQKRFERTFFHFFYFCFSQRKKPLTFHGTSEAL